MGDYARGLAYLREANDSLRVKPESDASTLASDFLRFRAETFVQLKQPDSVLACYRQAYRLSDCKSSEYAADARAFVVTCRAFTTLYPRFLTRLRVVCPQLTASNELVCMLIYLHLSNEEIAQCLGITRMSVNSARYLIRKKLNLDKATDLNDYICSLDSVS